VSTAVTTDLAKLKGLGQWPALRREVESLVLDVLGKLPKERVDTQLKVIDETSYPGYVRQRVNYFVGEWERISAWMFVPEGRDELPAILCCHQTVPQGKNEPAGLDGDPNLAFARYFAQLGFITIAPDCITAGERISPRFEPYDTAPFYKENPRMSAMGKMLIDHIHAVDAMAEHSRVDEERIGVIGHSLGGYNALFLTAMDERVQTCVASCGFTRFADDKNPERWAREEGFVHFPKLREAITQREYPFDWEHILALCAPSPTRLLTALNDDIFPKTKSCEKATKLARNVYKLLGEPDALDNFTHKDGHGVTPEGLEMASEWFDRWL
jgi:cephalosporin-C deacetylase-like acetyl esterase